MPLPRIDTIDDVTPYRADIENTAIKALSIKNDLNNENAAIIRDLSAGNIKAALKENEPQKINAVIKSAKSGIETLFQDIENSYDSDIETTTNNLVEKAKNSTVYQYLTTIENIVKGAENIARDGINVNVKADENQTNDFLIYGLVALGVYLIVK